MQKIIVDISWQDNYGASSNDILGCVATAATLEKVKDEFISALEFHLSGLEADEIPEAVKKDYQLVFKMDVHALLNHYKGAVTHGIIAAYSGINKKQLGHYAQGARNARPLQRKKIVDALHKIGAELQEIA